MVGQGQAKALEAAFKTIGPINGRTVQVITEDAQGEAASAVDAARKLVENDHVVAIFGPTEIGQKAAVGNYIKSVSIPEIIYNPSPAEMFTGNKWIIGSGGAVPQCPQLHGRLPVHQGQRQDHQHAHRGQLRRARVHDPLTDVFTAAGGKVLKQQWVPENVGDFSPYLSTLPDADSLVAWEPGGAGIKLFIQWYGLGLYKTMPIAAAYHGGFTDPFIPAALPPKVAAEVVGTLAPQFYYPSNPSPENQLMQKTLTPILGFPPADDGSSGPWQAALLFQAGVEANKGDTTGDTLVTAILGSTITGPEGTESFPNGAQFATKTVYILKCGRGSGPRQGLHLQTWSTRTRTSRLRASAPSKVEDLEARDMGERISRDPHLRTAGRETPTPCPSPFRAAPNASGDCSVPVGSFTRIGKPARKRMF